MTLLLDDSCVYTIATPALATLPEDFQRLAPRRKTMVCEIVRTLLRAEKR